MNSTGYYIRSDHRSPGQRVYHDPSGHFRNGHACMMIRLNPECYEWVEKPPKGYRLCGRCPKGTQ